MPDQGNPKPIGRFEESLRRYHSAIEVDGARLTNFAVLSEIVSDVLAYCSREHVSFEAVLKEAQRLQQARRCAVGSVALTDVEDRETRLHDALSDRERETIESTLRRLNYNRAATARMLGVSRVTLYNKLRKYGISLPYDGEMDGQ